MILGLIGGETAALDFGADPRQLFQRRNGLRRVRNQRLGTVNRFQFGRTAVRQQCLAVGRAIERHRLTCLARHGDHVVHRDVVNEQRLLAFPHGQMRRLIRLAGQFLEGLMTERDQHAAPVILARQAPDRWTQDVVLPATGNSQEAAALQSIGKAEDAAAVNGQKFR